MKKLSRREFLSAVGTGSLYTAVFWKNIYPFNVLFDGLVQSFSIQMAQAQAVGTSSGNYLLFLHPGAPPRWGMDAFLSPTSRVLNGVGNDEFILNPVVKNTLKSGDNYITAHSSSPSASTYETTSDPVQYLNSNGQNKSIYLPKIWDVSLPVLENGIATISSQTPFRMRDMLSNVCLIRGFQINADFGHGRGPSFLSQPQPSKPSLTGLVADKSVGSIPAVAVTDSASRALGFRSERSKITLVSAGNSNLNSAIFSPFIRTDTGIVNSKANRALVETAMREAFLKMKEDAATRFLKVEDLYANVAGVDALMEKLKGLNPIGDFVTLKSKYEKLVRGSSKAEAGIIANYSGMSLNAEGVPSNVPYQSDPYSEKFALAEYLVKNNICSSFTFLCGGSAVGGSFGGGNPSSAQNDEHDVTDRFLSAASHNWKYRAFMACVNEFRKSIGSAAWKNTVIQHGAEYARSPNQSSGGSDHGIGACSTTLISGAFNSFVPIGNIYKTHVNEPTHKNYGTWGVGARVAIGGLGETRIPFEFVVNTVLSMFGIDSPFRDKASLLKRVGTSWLSNCEDPKNIV